jgi:HEAT repeat protein
VRLDQVCARLESAVSAGYGDLDAAEALAFINDPIAVPHIARVLSVDQRFGWLLFSALGRIGSADAVETLISYLSGSTEEARSAARVGLSRLLQTTTDPAIKSRIKAFFP